MTATAGDQAEAASVSIHFRAETDLRTWGEDYGHGRVPDRFPYGLHKLADSGLVVDWVASPAASRAQKLRQLIPTRRPATAPGWTLAWDEYTALRMLATGPRTRLGAGAIWLTDGRLRGGLDRLRAASLTRALSSLDLVWALSAAQIEPLRRAFGRRGPRIAYLEFGIAADFFTPTPLPERPSILSIGGDRDRDNPTLLRALERVRRIRPDVPIRVQLRDATSVPDGVERLPRMSHDGIRDLYRDATVVAIATRPNLHVSGMTTALEGMASGRAVVMTRTPGSDDYVAHGRTGLLTAVGDDAALAEAIITALEPATAAALGRESRREVEARFTTDAMAGRLAGLLSA